MTADSIGFHHSPLTRCGVFIPSAERGILYALHAPEAAACAQRDADHLATNPPGLRPIISINGVVGRALQRGSAGRRSRRFRFAANI